MCCSDRLNPPCKADFQVDGVPTGLRAAPISPWVAYRSHLSAPNSLIHKPAAAISSGRYTLRRSTTTGCFIVAFSRSRSSARNWTHSVTITSASAVMAHSGHDVN
jgi:hypothetical protein